MKRCAKYLSILALALTCGWSTAGELEDIIAKNIESKGGRKAIESIESLRMSGKMVLPSMGAEFPIVITSKGKSVHFKTTFQGASMEMGVTAEDAWMINPMMGSPDPQDLPPEMSEQVARNSDMFEGFLIDYKEKGYEVSLLGKEDVEGTECHKISVTRGDEDPITVYLEAESCIEIKIVMKASDMMGNNYEAHNYFSEYQEVAGMMMAHTTTTKDANGTVLTEMVFEKLEPNIAVEDSFFERPPAGQ